MLFKSATTTILSLGAIQASTKPRICPTSFQAGDTGSVTQFDGVISLFGSRTNNTCIVNVDENIKYQNCGPDDIPRWKANEWEHTSDGKIKRVGSNRCFLVPDLTRKLQLIKVKGCEGREEANQQFDVVNGRIHVRASPELCLAVVDRNSDGSELGGISAEDWLQMDMFEDGWDIMAVPCRGNNFSNGKFTSANCDGEGYVFGEGTGFVHNDGSIRPFGDTENCLYARGTVAENDPIFIGACEADAQHAGRSEKYKWTVENGQIKSQKDASLCMTVSDDSGRDPGMTKMYLSPCGEEQTQIFSFADGEIRGVTSTSCLGFKTHDLSENGKALMHFSECWSSSFPRVSNGAGTGRGLEVMYLTDRSYASLTEVEDSLMGSDEDWQFVEDFVFDANTGLLENGFEDLFLSMYYFGSETESDCFNGAHGFTGAPTVLTFEKQIGALDALFDGAADNGTDLCQTSDIQVHLPYFGDQVVARKDDGRDQTVILIVGTKDNIDAEAIKSLREAGVDVFGVMIGGKWDNILARANGGQAIPFTRTFSAASASDLSG